MSYMHTYEYECTCGNKMKAEVHHKFDEHPSCSFCHKIMDMTFYLRSTDVRACACGGDCEWPTACGVK